MPALPLIFCFAGQGSQYFTMAAELMETEGVFRQWMELGDGIVARRQGFSVLDEIYRSNRRGQPFERLHASHPAIFMVQYALAKLFQHHHIRPDMLLGVSLGEFVAQAVAGMISFETALAAVADQPGLFQSCRPGAMIGVLGAPAIHARSPLLAQKSEIAGINAANHFVLSALAEDLPQVEEQLRQADMAFQRLPVPFAFHSRFVAEAEPACRAAHAHLRLESPFWPVWSCCTAAFTPTGPDCTDLAWRIVRQSMNVARVVATIEGQGGAVYLDLSPSGTLAALFRQSLDKQSPSRLLSVLSPFGGDGKRLADTLAALRS